MERILCLVAGYFVGTIPNGYAFGRTTRGIDIRKYGSHSTGATNTLRVLGTKSGILVFLLDFLKGFLPCLIAGKLFPAAGGLNLVLILWTGLGVVLGHDFPVWLRFKGGKGIASTAGVIMALDPAVAFGVIAFFILVVIFSRFISLGSISAMVLLAILLSVFCLGGRYGVTGTMRTEFILISVLISALAVYRHRSNIGRLLAGTENKFKFKTKGNLNEGEKK